ncbi:MAG: iron-containing alcohol dehydrogenase [Desulfobacteraceae bacterium]
MTDFSFSTAGRIIFGAGAAGGVAAKAAQLGGCAMLVTGSQPERNAALAEDLKRAGVAVHGFTIDREPDIDGVAKGAEEARRRQCDLVIGIGGGSVLDSAKAIAALIPNRRPIIDYLEVIGRAMPLEHPPAPCIAIPTTSGTGSEVTRNAVIRSPRHRVKVSLRHPEMLPDLAVVDPALTLTLPPETTAATGFDALAQLLETFVSIKANPLTDGLCREGLVRCARALKTAFHHGADLAARTEMAIASLFSGLALANAGLGAVHGIAGPLGGMVDAPHGAVCACLLPAVAAANIKALEAADRPGSYLLRYQEAARLLTGDSEASPRDGVEWLRSAARELQIPALSHWGLTEADVAELAGHALRASSMKGNPVALAKASLTAIIAQALKGVV